MVLRKNTEVTSSNYVDNTPEKRLFLLLLGQSDNSFKPAIKNENAVLCIDCAGTYGDPFIGATIKNGNIIIEHGIAGGAHWQEVTTFKFNKAKNDWFLIKTLLKSYSKTLEDGKKIDKDYGLQVESEIIKTEKDFGNIPLKDFDIYKKL